jgi:hypothetical protein
MSGNLRLGREEIPDHVAAHVKFELAIQQQQRPVGLWAAWNDGDVESTSGVSAVGRRLKEAARRRIGQPIGAERHLVERQRRPSEAEQSHQGRKHRQSHFDTPRPYGLFLMAYSEAKAARSKAARAEVASFPGFARRVASCIAGRVLPAHVRSVYMAAAKLSMLLYRRSTPTSESAPLTRCETASRDSPDLSCQPDKLIGGEAIDLPINRNVQRRVRHKLNQMACPQMVSHQFNWVHPPAHAGEARLDKTLGRRKPVGGMSKILPECLGQPPALQSVLLVEGEGWRIADRFRGDHFGKISGYEIGARCCSITKLDELY